MNLDTYKKGWMWGIVNQMHWDKNHDSVLVCGSGVKKMNKILAKNTKSM